MKRGAAYGGALVELLASTAVAGLMMVIMVQALGGVQRAWSNTQRSAGRETTTQQALATLSSMTSSATLNVRQHFDLPLHPAQLVTDSDLHFVCGPASELLPGMAHAAGDAVFFQRVNNEGLVEGCGFYVQYGGDFDRAPEGLRSTLEPRRRFRLMQFREPAARLGLFQPASMNQSVSKMATLVRRDELYAWFRQPLTDPAASLEHTAVVADNVVALLVRPAPDDQRCYDTRRFQWDGQSPESARSRHALPRSLELTIITTDETDWARLQASGQGSAELKIEAFLRTHFQAGTDRQADAADLRRVGDGLKLQMEVSSITVSLTSVPP